MTLSHSPHLVGSEPVAAQSRHLHRLLAFLDLLLRRPPLIVELHHRPIVRLQGRHDEARSGEQFPNVKLDLRHHPPRRRPTGGLVPKALVPDHRLVTGSSYGPRQQLRDVPLQAVIGRDPDGVPHIPLFQGLVDLRFGEGSIGAKDHFLALFLLPLDLWQEHVVPVLGAVDVARPQLRRQTVAIPIEQQQWMIAPGWPRTFRGRLGRVTPPPRPCACSLTPLAGAGRARDSMADCGAGIRKRLAVLRNEFPRVAVRSKGEFKHAKGTGVPHLALGGTPAHRVVAAAAGSDHKLPDPANAVEPPGGIQGRESFVVMVMYRGPGPRPVSAPRGVVAIDELLVGSEFVGVVAGREHRSRDGVQKSRRGFIALTPAAGDITGADEHGQRLG